MLVLREKNKPYLVWIFIINVMKGVSLSTVLKVVFFKKKKNLWPIFMDGVQLPQGYSHFEEAVYFLPFSSQKFLVLILSTSSESPPTSCSFQLTQCWCAPTHRTNVYCDWFRHSGYTATFRSLPD